LVRATWENSSILWIISFKIVSRQRVDLRGIKLRSKGFNLSYSTYYLHVLLLSYKCLNIASHFPGVKTLPGPRCTLRRLFP
jgi:hypothetical protein